MHVMQNPIAFAEEFFGCDLAELGHHLLCAPRVFSHIYSQKIDQFILAYLESNSVGKQSVEYERMALGEVRPLYLGVSCGADAHRESIEKFPRAKPWFAMAASLSPSLLWDETAAFSELKAILLYSHSVVMFDPIQDFVDRAIIKEISKLPNNLQDDTNSSLLVRAWCLREGIEPCRLNNEDKHLLHIAVARLFFFLAAVKPFFDRGLVTFIERTENTSISKVRRDLIHRDQDCLRRGRAVMSAYLPRHEFRAEIMKRAIEEYEWLDLYSPFARELNYVQRCAQSNKFSTMDGCNVVSSIGRLRLPNLQSLSLNQIYQMHKSDDFVEWRRLLRRVLTEVEVGDQNAVCDELTHQAAKLRASWMPEVTATALGFAVTTLIGMPDHAMSGIVSGGAGIVATASANYIFKEWKSRLMRRHLLAITGLTANRVFEFK
jgi:hypothetical protein